jgi:hypothetical protein
VSFNNLPITNEVIDKLLKNNLAGALVTKLPAGLLRYKSLCQTV